MVNEEAVYLVFGITLVTLKVLSLWAPNREPPPPGTPEQVERWIFRDMRYAWMAYARRNKEIELATLVDAFVSSELRSIEFNFPELIRRVGAERVTQRIMDVIEKSGTHARADVRRVTPQELSRLVETSGA